MLCMLMCMECVVHVDVHGVCCACCDLTKLRGKVVQHCTAAVNMTPIRSK